MIVLKMNTGILKVTLVTGEATKAWDKTLLHFNSCPDFILQVDFDHIFKRDS